MLVVGVLLFLWSGLWEQPHPSPASQRVHSSTPHPASLATCAEIEPLPAFCGNEKLLCPVMHNKQVYVWHRLFQSLSNCATPRHFSIPSFSANKPTQQSQNRSMKFSSVLSSCKSAMCWYLALIGCCFTLSGSEVSSQQPAFAAISCFQL